jgi:GTP-binding protein Era
MNNNSRCGYIAIVGRPNVGKSTLLNAILGTKVSITSRKPQTTRHRILGIKTLDNVQTVYVDTPGLHRKAKHLINQYMIQTAIHAIADVDIIIFVIDARYWKEEDDFVLQEIMKTKQPVILVLNKIDRLNDPASLLRTLEDRRKKLANLGLENIPMVPVAANSGRNIAELEKVIAKELPENPHFFPDDQLTDRSERFMAAEFIREKLMRQLGQEVPHELAVQIEEFKVKKKILHISAIIFVERPGQKKIVIGENGDVLKHTGTLARQDMEAYFDQKVFLRLWVKIKRGWTDDERALLSLGYGE